MNVRALVCTLGAAGVISCGSGIAAEEIRNSGRISLPPSIETPPERPFRMESCLEMGRRRLGTLAVKASRVAFDLATFSCDACRIGLSISAPKGWTFPPSMETLPPISDLRAGYLYGRLALSAPSDSVLEEIHDLCLLWSDDDSYAPACAWRNVSADLWESETFAARVVEGEPYFAHLFFDEVQPWDERRSRAESLPLVGASDLIVKTGFAPLYAAVRGFSGMLSFEPRAVEIVDPNSETVLGCLPASE